MIRLTIEKSSAGSVGEVEGATVQKSCEPINMDAPGALRHVFKYVGALVDGARPSKDVADWEKVGSYPDGVVADKKAAELCEQGYFSKIQSIGEYSPELRYVLNDYSPSVDVYFKAHPNESAIDSPKKNYSVTVRLESGKNEFYDCEATSERDAKQQAGWAYVREGVVIDVAESKVYVPAQSLYAALKAAGIEIDNHESDLYVSVTPESTAILAKYPTSKANATTFKSNIDGKLNYDVSFAFEPFWDKKSLFHAQKIASEKASFEQADSSIDKAYSGKVMGVTDCHVVLSLGRTALIVAQSDLDRVPVKDEEVSVTFKDGKGMVQPGKERDGVER